MSQGPIVKTRFYEPALDALRFFAFLMVYGSHMPIVPGWFGPIREVGRFGVQIFFCLSAYLIVTLLLMEREETGAVRLRSFALRRILRIWPLFLLILGISWSLGRVVPLFHLSGTCVLMYMVMLGNIYAVHHSLWDAVLVLHLWTICVEEQFYLFIPFLVKTGGRKALRVACCLVLAVAYAYIFWVGRHGLVFAPTLWGSSLVEFQFFAAGAAIALFTWQRTLRFNGALRLLTVLAAFGCLALATYVSRFSLGGHMLSAGRLAVMYLLALLGSAGLVLGLLQYRGSVPAVLTYLGKISYGLYIFHVLGLGVAYVLIARYSHAGPFLTNHPMLESAIGLLFTFACAALSYRYFEKPILKLKERFEIVRSRPA